MKTKKIVGLSILCLIVVLVIAGIITINSMQKSLDDLLTTEIEAVDLSTVPDGTYFGEYTAFPVKVQVQVGVTDGVITEIVLLLHQNGQGTPAEVILEDVVTDQSLQVDSIAGATYSSKVILLAIHNALTEQAPIE
jgi:uncharacterized protein with FMN-binding domain